MSDGAARGVLLVGVAVVIGLLLLGSGLDDSAPVAAPATSDDAADDGGNGGAGGGGNQNGNGNNGSVVPSTRDPAQVPVLVANGSEVSGAAGAVTELLTALGYTGALPAVDTNPDANEQFDTVYYLEGFEADAAGVAQALGLAADAVLPMPATPPANLGNAQVLVVLGSGGTLATSATAGTTVPAG
jgi:hypothetical protein